MDIQFSTDVEKVSWDDLARVVELAPLGKKDPKKLELAFRNSLVRCFAYHEGRLIGAGRAVSDGVWRAAIYDVVVLPEYQGKGIGTQIMGRIVQEANVDVIMLFAAPGKETFYSKLGFRKMKTAMAIMSNPELRREKGFIE
ncbi:MAG: GNAT family N-acetyltransferase [Elusimicrobia bacterium]|nr:GNAT family N-acetyltransferase [Elusimicrobiota bacterium]